MQTITTIGLDIAKSVFQVHGVDAGGQVIVRRQLKRRYVLVFFQKLSPCLVGIEACASAHHWSRELQALGHTVRLIPPAYVKPYVKRQDRRRVFAGPWCWAGVVQQFSVNNVAQATGLPEEDRRSAAFAGKRDFPTRGRSLIENSANQVPDARRV
jgi:hypothetical protein